MALAAGDKLGPYEIVAPIGAGGMGAVYRARDARLGRDVAIKISSERFSERFEREARAVAALNHPNICHLYDVGVSDSGVSYLVMELVEGETLAARIKRGAIPLDEALAIARQITDALEAAHEKGITHRDLKPGNVMLRPEGSAGGGVKVLDFGLAKVQTPGRESSPGASEGAGPENSPTLTIGMTNAGVILGTAAYMSPEQAKGKNVDKRADIWAFGVVLYEMLTGERPFHGEEVGDILASVIKEQPGFDKIPPQVRPLLESCLEKDPRKRLRDIGDAWRLLSRDSNGAGIADRRTATIPAPLLSRLGYVPWIVAAMFGIAALGVSFVHFREQPPAAESVIFEVAPPEMTVITGLSVSPDGRQLAFTARDTAGRTELWVRSFGSPEPHALGVQAAPGSAFWSPDSHFIGFATPFNSKLMRIDAMGGAADTICDLAGGALRGATWNAAGVVIFSALGNVEAGETVVQHVPAAGGTPSRVTLSQKLISRPTNLSFLPDGRHFLYQQVGAAGQSNGIFVGALDAKPEQQSSQRLLAASGAAVFVPPASGDHSSVGHILFDREGTVMAQPFDASRLELHGDAFPVVRGVASGIRPMWSVSRTGTLVFETGRPGVTSHLVWRDRHGKPIGEVGPPANYSLIQLSFDGRRVVVGKPEQQTGNGTRVWVADLSRGIFSRVDTGGANENSPAISADGLVAMTSIANGAAGDIYVSRVNSTEMPELWVKADPKSPIVMHPNGFSADGRFLIYDAHDPQRRQDLFVVPTSGEHKPIPFLTTPADETFGQFSPDGKWIAYDSDESGRREMYVQGFAPDHSPATAVGKWQISSAGGNKPRWSHDGKELFYLSLDNQLMAVPIKSGTTLEPGVAAPLFPVRSTGFFSYDVSPDGRFLFNTPADSDSAPTSITVVLNWQAGLKK